MWLSQWLRPPRHLLLLFLAIAVVLATVLGWLSWRMLQQDRALAGQRVQERLDYAADVIAATLLRKLSESENQLALLLALPDSELAAEVSRQAEPLGENVLIAVFRPQSIDGYGRTGLLYYPLLPAAKEPPASVFAEGEDLEFKQSDYAKASATFRQLVPRYPAPFG